MKTPLRLPKVYKVTEVAMMFLVDERTVLKEIKCQDLPVIVMGERIIRIPQESLDILKKTGINYYGENKRV